MAESEKDTQKKFLFSFICLSLFSFLLFYLVDFRVLPSTIKGIGWHWGFCTEVIEHLANPKKCLQETKRVLKPNGHFLVSTYNHYNFFNLLTGRAFSQKPRFPEAHKREYSWFSFKREIGKFFIIVKTSQAASTDLLERLITLAKVPVGDFMIILSKN